MSIYLHSIQIGVLLFFVFLLLALIPYLIIQYRRYGHVNSWRFFVNFSFVLYLICAYAMTIFPLPPVEEVAQMTGPKQNLIPFEFVKQFMLHSPFRWDDPSTWLAGLKNFTFIQPFFNLLLTFPFGLYLRYLFKRTFKQTLILSFLLTLSFELLQRSALLGLYPRPYRLFDVDDLMINTVGSLVGFGFAVLFSRFLPDLEATYFPSSRVSLLRRFTALLVDVFLISVVGIFLPQPYVAQAVLLLLIPILFKTTLGQMVLKIKIDGKNRFRVLIRQMLFCVSFIPVGLEGYFLERSGTIPHEQLAQNYLLILLFLALMILPLFDLLVASFSKTRRLWYERISGTQIISQINLRKED